ncbi:MAG TPA: HDOD domain-containing protein [Dissulfurispiraceae bacterium]|nr:HDOD domain-containing protein [Dissulfurispiraceae bacterium]
MMENEPARKLLEKIQAGYSLPSLSLVALKLVDLAASESASIEDMATLIETDPALTVRLIRLANSVFFKTSSPIMTVEQAIMRIGANHLRIMALSLSLRDTFPMGKVGNMDYERFWRSSLYQGILAQTLAKSLSTCKSEEAFVGGLVLEIGFLIFHDLFLNEASVSEEHYFYPLAPLLEWERRHFGINHREVGEAALRFWRFPEAIISCQRVHSLDSSADLPSLAVVCEVAREFAALICEESMEWSPLFEKAEKVYSISHDVLSDILVSTLEEVENIADSLRVQMDKDQDIVGLMQKANTSLSELSAKVLLWQEHQQRTTPPSFDALQKGQLAPEVRSTLQAVAHEIRNPLLVVGGFAKRLSHSLDRRSNSWRYVQIILEESKRLESALAAMTGESTAN